MLFAPLEGWRHVKPTARRTAVDYAHVLKEVSDVHFPRARTIVLVQDNLNTHAPSSLYEAFPPTEARRIAERFEWHYSPKHGSWLNMAEAELSSWRGNASTGASPMSRHSSNRSRPGSSGATNITPKPIGASQHKMHASN